MRRYLYVRETKGKNRSPEIDMWNRFVGSPLGAPYCAAAMSWALHEAGYASPKKSALALGLVDKSTFSALKVTQKKAAVEVGDLLLWQTGDTYRGHVEVVIEVINYKTVRTIGANTSSGKAGSQRDGDGVFIRVREINPLSYFGIRKVTRPSKKPSESPKKTKESVLHENLIKALDHV